MSISEDTLESHLTDVYTSLCKRIDLLPRMVANTIIASCGDAIKDVINEENSSTASAKYHEMFSEYLEWLSKMHDSESLISPVEARDRLILLGQSKGLLKAGDED
tara:strand:+ start:1374 stop:1688 length:315 start_codon:yes stop_codon:yes gene_type:complete